MNLDLNTLNAILAIITGGIAVPVVQWLKKLLKIDGGWKATLLTLAETMAVTAGYLIFVTHAFTLSAFALLVVVAFGSASGFYTVTINKKPA